MTGRPVIDPAALDMLQRVGTHALVERMVGMFLASAPSRLKAASVAARNGDREAVERTAHSLRSSAGQIGAVHLQECCERLETGAAGDAPVDELARLTVLADEALTHAVEALSAVLGPREIVW